MDNIKGPGDSTEAFVFRARQGETEAIGCLYQQYRPRIVSFLAAHASLLPPATREDITEETMKIALFEGLGGLKHPSKFPAWMIGIARNLVLQELKRHVIEGISDPEDLVEFVSGGPDSLDKAMRNEVALLIRRMVEEQLSPRQSLAVKLYYFEELPIEAVARTMKITEGAVKATLYQARAALRQCWLTSGRGPEGT